MEGVKVCLHVGSFFVLGNRREDGDGGGEGDFAVFVHFDGRGDEDGVVVGRRVGEAKAIVGKLGIGGGRRRRRRTEEGRC